MKKSKPAVIGGVIAVACAASVIASAQGNSPSGPDDVIAVGPVDSVSASGRELIVLGRVFHTADEVALSSGDYVAVHAEMKRDGSLTDAWVESLGTYVPGSDLVYEKGVVTEIKPFLGHLSIGESQVDYTASMYASHGVGPGLGDVVAVSGMQPSSQSPVLVDSLMASADRARDAVLRGGGVHTSSIQGSGVQIASMQGSGVQSASIQGSGFRSASMQGSGVQSASIQGSGFRSASMQGSGVQSASIQGSGFRSASMQGSGVQSASIQGSGFRSASMQGSGVQSASIQGSGIASK